MYWTTHIAVGALLGSRSRSRLSALAMGAISHPLLDTIPHYDFKNKIFSAGDFIIGLALLNLLVDDRDNSKIILGALGGGAPDIEGGLVYFHLISKRRAYFHKLFPHSKTSLARALVQESLIIAAAYLIVKNNQKKPPSNPAFVLPVRFKLNSVPLRPKS
ncbi:MAG TPA: hypothetical protein ENH19_03200 [Actinobacteria bacterium]|nr:hypothetical protein [Actinomycetes bacterium]HEX21643.1 hypothetical protein [Actinomycetota bacterium]